MANAIVREQVVITESGITLELSDEEATNLMTMLSLVDTDSAVDTYPIFQALYRARVRVESKPSVRQHDGLLLVGGVREERKKFC